MSTDNVNMTMRGLVGTHIGECYQRDNVTASLWTGVKLSNGMPARCYRGLKMDWDVGQTNTPEISWLLNRIEMDSVCLQYLNLNKAASKFVSCSKKARQHFATFFPVMSVHNISSGIKSFQTLLDTLSYCRSY